MVHFSETSIKTVLEQFKDCWQWEKVWKEFWDMAKDSKKLILTLTDLYFPERITENS